MLCTETGEKYSVDDIQCCVLKQEKNGLWLIYSVVYRNRREIERGLYTVLSTETGEK